MSRIADIANLFSRRSKQPPAARKRRSQQAQRFAAPEALERRAMLAFAPLPAAGDQLGAQIVISSDSADPGHDLTIILDDVTNPLSVTATITTFDATNGTKTGQFFNFSGISYSASNDTNGSVVNKVSLWTSYDANLLGKEMAPSADAAVGLSTNWIVSNSFAGLGTVDVGLVNADALTVTGGVLGGGNSTIRGEFESPTLAANIDPTNPDTYANISLFSGTGIANVFLLDPIVAHALTLESQTGKINLSQDIYTTSSLSIRAAGDVKLSGYVTSTAGDISVRSDSRLETTATLVAGRDIELDADLGVSTLTGGLANNAVNVLSPGAFYDFATVTIAAPASGSGRAATAEATITPVVVSPTGVVSGGEITGIVIIDPGYGYLPGEQPLVTITGSPSRTFPFAVTSLGETVTLTVTVPGGAGAVAVATAPLTAPAILAGRNAVVRSKQDIGLSTVIEAQEGDIEIASSSGSVTSAGLLNAEQGNVLLTALSRSISVADIRAGDGVEILAAETITVSRLIEAEAGDVTLISTSGSIDLSNTASLIHAMAGHVTATAAAGEITVQDVYAGGGITIYAAKDVTVSGITVAQKAISVSSDRDIALENAIISENGAISVASSGGAISLSANVKAAEGVVFSAAASIVQSSESGVKQLTVVSGGSRYTAGAVVKIAQPTGGGTEATASAVIIDGVVTGLIITNPGSGYAVGESPVVTITGNLVGGGGQNALPPSAAGSGAAAVALGPTALPSIEGKSIKFQGNAGVKLTSTVIATDGNVLIESSSGGLSLDAGSVLIQSRKGDVTLNAGTGFVAVRNVISQEDVTVDAFGRITLAGDIASSAGNVYVESTAASIDVTANLRAEAGTIAFKAKSSINQAAETGISKIELINGGSGFTLGATVTIAAPLGGGAAAKAVAIIENGIVTRLVVTDSGSGYAVGEDPETIILGGASAGAVSGTGAAARAFGPLSQQQVLAGKGITIDAGTGVALRSTIIAQEGDINVRTTVGNLSLDAGALLIESLDGSIHLSASAGVVSAQRLLASEKVDVEAYFDASVTGEAKAGSDITVKSHMAKATVRNLSAGNSIKIHGNTGVSLGGEIKADGALGGDLFVMTAAGELEFAANIVAENAIEFLAGGAVNQLNTTGISEITLQAGGSGYTAGAEVQIAQPAAGGIAAEAEVILEFGVVTKIIITSAGSGYAVGETPSVTITGNLSGGGIGGPTPTGSGASAVAIGPSSVPRVVAGEEIIISGRTGVALNSLFESRKSEIRVQSDVGNLSLDGGSLKLKAATDILLETAVGGIAAGNLFAGDQIKVDSKNNISLRGEIVADGGGLDVESQNGAISVEANIAAANGAISLIAASSLTQVPTGGLVKVALVAGGAGYTDRVVVAIAAPQGGGIAAQASAIVTNGSITGLILTNSGSGYAVGERPTVTFSAGPEDAVNAGGAGAYANAIGPVSLPRMYAKDDIEIEAGAGVTLTTLIQSTEGDVSAHAKTGDLTLDAGSLLILTNSTTNAISLTADTGSVNVQRIDAAGTATIAAGQGVSVVKMSAGGYAMISAETVVQVKDFIESRAGVATISSTIGSITVNDVIGGDGISIASGDSFLLKRLLRADSGDVTISSNRALNLGTSEIDSSVIAHEGNIVVTSKASGIGVDARLVATKGEIAIVAQGAITQATGTGLVQLEIVNGGLSGVLPDVTLTIARPAAGGEAATATAVIGSRQVGVDSVGAPVFNFFIESVEVTNVGKGYAVGENPLVTVEGIRGAVIRAYGPSALRNLVAGDGVTISGGDSVTLVNTVTATGGDIAIRSISGDLNLEVDTLFIHAEAGSIELEADCGQIIVERVCAFDDVTITAPQGVTVEDEARSDTGSVDIIAEAGDATVRDLWAGDGVAVSAGQNVFATGTFAALNGDISIESTAESVRLSGNLVAHAGKVLVAANSQVTQEFSAALNSVELVAPGSVIFGSDQTQAPEVIITIAAPDAAGGIAATAAAIIGSRLVAGSDFTGDIDVEYFIQSIALVNPGRGYALGESPLVTITGMSGAIARAIGPTGLRNITAGNGIEVVASNSVKLVNTVYASGGDIFVRSESGHLDLAADTLFIHAESGAVELEADCGEIVVERVCAEDAITVTAPQGVRVENELRSATASVTITADAGPVEIKDIYAGTDVRIAAAQDVGVTGLVQASNGGIAISSTSGGLSVTGSGKIHSLAGTVDLVSNRGSTILQDLFAHKNLTIASLGDVALNGAIQSTTADVIVESDGNINNGARILTGGSIKLSADLSVTSLGGGIVRLELLSGGINYDYGIVTIAPPAAGGGRAALARATINSGVITGLTIVDPGYGYSPNERVQVRIEGNPEQRDQQGRIVRPAASGATAAAFSGAALSSLSAGAGVAITAGTAIDITNEVRAKGGAVNLNVTAGTLEVSDIFASEDIGLTAAQTIQIAGLLRSDAGNVAIESKGGGVDLRGTILAPSGGASVQAAGQIVQRGGSVSRDRIYLLSGGRQYTYALVVVDPPPGAGETALARAVITYYDPLDIEAGGYISEIILLDGGWGYPSDSRVNVRIQGDGEGAAAVFATDLVTSSIDVRNDVAMLSGDSITLVSAVRSSAGDVSIRNTLGDISVQSVTAGQDADVVSERGEVTLVSVATGGDATISAFRGVTVTDSVNSVVGDISIETRNGDLSFVQAFDFGDNYLVDDAATVLLPRAVIASEQGGITLTAFNGSIVTPYVMNAAKNVAITTFGALELANDITSTGGDIVARSTSGLVRLRSNIAADTGSITVQAQTQLQQETVSGISKIELLSPGPMLDVPPDVTVTIAAPREGGVPARAIAVIERRALNNNRDNQNNQNNEDVIAYEYFIGSIAIIDAGRGYAVGEQPVVTITGVAGASARAFGPTVVAMLTAQDDITLAAGENVTLLTKIHSVAGDIGVSSKTGDLDLSAGSLLLSAKAGSIDIDAHHGSAKIQRLAGAAGVTADALYGLQVLGSVHSGNGAISLATANGAANVRHLNAKNDVSVTSFQTATLGGEIASVVGDVLATSTAGGLFLQANFVAGRDISLAGQTFIEQSQSTGLEQVDVIARGSVISSGGTAAVPSVTVTIAAPLAGGEAATAQAIIGQRSLGRNAQADQETIEFFIESIFITNPGRGYALGEKPIVTIFGMPGAVARGVGPTNLRNITAGRDLSIKSKDFVTLLHPLTAMTGDLAIATIHGDINLASGKLRMTVPEGSVSIETISGNIVAPPVLNVKGDVTLKSFGPLTIANQLTTSGGDVTLAARGGSVELRANVLSGDKVDISAKTGISQTGGFVKADTLRLTNTTSTAITLGSSTNDIARLSAINVGNVTYNDANDFEVGIERNPPVAQKVEVKGDAVSLSSVARDSTIRVVAGIDYRTLSIAAGTLGGSNIGMVEFVTTSPTDNPNAAFQGTLRDMIRLASNNRATFLSDGATIPQPMKMVFDEAGYVVSEINVTSALPAFTKPMIFDGSRVDPSVATGRLGIRGSATARTGLILDAGSRGSIVKDTALYGFTGGSALVVRSQNNLVTNTFFGMKADQTSTLAQQNAIGINIVGGAATGNVIGSSVFDTDTVNRFARNTNAGIMIQGRASGNRVVGNVIGLSGSGNGHGIRIVDAVNNQIGMAGQMTPDDQLTTSNLIQFNTGSGISIENSKPGAWAAANRIENNVISSNATTAATNGIKISGSRFVTVGGDSLDAANEIHSQNAAGSGVGIVGSTDVAIRGNFIGTNREVSANLANSRHGIDVTGSSKAVSIDGNRIAANKLSGISVGTGVTGVNVTNNEIGGLLSDGTTSAGNKQHGVAITGSLGNTVGAGNRISRNSQSGVAITNAVAATMAAGNRVFGSEIFANLHHGVLLSGASRTTVGGTTPSDANVITSNLRDGIRVEASATARVEKPTGNLITGNLIGTNVNEDVDATLGNRQGIVINDGVSNVASGNIVINNVKDGVQVRGGAGNVIGGITAAAANFIGYNGRDGVLVSDRLTSSTDAIVGAAATTLQNQIVGNEIVRNVGDGVQVEGSKTVQVVVGQDLTGKAVAGRTNTIADNGGYGVLVSAAQQVGVQGNSIYGNALGAISLAASANQFVGTPPQIDLSYVGSGNNGTTIIEGYVSGDSLQQYSIDVYANPPHDGNTGTLQGYQMRTLVGRMTVTAGQDGRAQFKFTVSSTIKLGDVLTLTATSLRYGAGSTSALSNAVVHRLKQQPTPVAPAPVPPRTTPAPVNPTTRTTSPRPPSRR